MSSHEPVVHSFIVRVWLEEGAEAEQSAAWHGQVTHVPGGENRYFRDWDDLNDFIVTHLGSANRERRAGLFRKLKRWLKLS